MEPPAARRTLAVANVAKPGEPRNRCTGHRRLPGTQRGQRPSPRKWRSSGRSSGAGMTHIRSSGPGPTRNRKGAPRRARTSGCGRLPTRTSASGRRPRQASGDRLRRGPPRVCSRATLERCLADADAQVHVLRAELEVAPAATSQRQRAARAPQERAARLIQALVQLSSWEGSLHPVAAIRRLSACLDPLKPGARPPGGHFPTRRSLASTESLSRN